ncbi:Tad domain-containing protein [Leisingera sp. McT4-56]|uniref:Tad domain-containing protein n=1 Tax=Leisingera sp. McT4-56 TaxID=2881255 RepID=UPI001CF8D62C|nr:Tad domain-containing protein [Leisingera sp. McT4-56]MCB4455792.1 pilus assembly protein TadG-related protein [Leisingera sp. McT4-56]
MSMRHKSSTALANPLMRRCLAKVKGFLREEDGVLANQALLTLLAMLSIGGIGIDLMRLERDRTHLQYTLDRAVLAAADLDQQKTPDAVVLDYLSKSGLAEHYTTPWWESGLGFKKVQATINSEFPAHWLNFAVGLSGAPGLAESAETAPSEIDIPLYATSRAEESIDGVEISLVLDVSGSMTRNSRLTNLKVAAKDFVDTMVANTTDGKMSMSIVPYATQVSIPQELYDQYNISTPGSTIYSRCVNFSGSDFQSTSLSLTSELEGTMHFTPWDSRTRDNRTYYDPSRLISTPVCEDDPRREILPLQKDATLLKDFIDDLWGGGNTSIDIGMKWGTTLLDPSARPAVNALSVSGDVPNDFSARPSAYTDTDTVKVIVLMTDGQNTSQYYVESDHREGDSNVWFTTTDEGTEVYSTLNPSSGQYYWHLPYGARWEDHPFGTGTEWYRNCYGCSWKQESGSAARLAYSDLFAYTSLKYLYYSLYGDWMSSAKSTWYYGVYDYYSNSTKNARTRSICQAAKDEGIIVYTIGFEAPSDGVAVLQDCASSDSHYFDVQGLEISDAFASIATSIRQLRLTQ